MTKNKVSCLLLSCREVIAKISDFCESLNYLLDFIPKSSMQNCINQKFDSQQRHLGQPLTLMNLETTVKLIDRLSRCEG